MAVVELLQEATESDRTAAKAMRGSLRIIIVLQCLSGWKGVDAWNGSGEGKGQCRWHRGQDECAGGRG